MKSELALDNVTVIHSRVEDANLPKFSLITARAFSSIGNIIKLAGRHCDIKGCLVLMKGIYAEKELQSITNDFR